MQKDFDTWNTYKKHLEMRDLLYCKSREIWWCSLGINVGAETCGKNELFERPVLVLMVYNQQSILIAPLTSKPKDGKFYQKINYEGICGWVILSHARTISPKRLQRKLAVLDKYQFEDVAKRLLEIMQISGYESAPVSTGASEPEGMMGTVYQSDLLSQADVLALQTLFI